MQIITFLLFFVFSIQVSLGQDLEIRSEDSENLIVANENIEEWILDQKDLDWKPSDPIEWIFPNNFKVINVFLFENVPAPYGGFLVKPDDWSEIERLINNAEEEKEKIKKEERRICDEELEKRKNDCKNLNIDLTNRVDLLEKEKKLLKKQYADLEDEYLYFKVGTGTVAAIACGLLVYNSL